jgi:hypothetical protein
MRRTARVKMRRRRRLASPRPLVRPPLAVPGDTFRPGTRASARSSAGRSVASLGIARQPGRTDLMKRPVDVSAGDAIDQSWRHGPGTVRRRSSWEQEVVASHHGSSSGGSLVRVSIWTHARRCLRDQNIPFS